MARMLFLLSPAKTLDYDTPVPAPVLKKATDPLFTDRAAELVDVLRRKTPAQVAGLNASASCGVNGKPDGASPWSLSDMRDLPGDEPTTDGMPDDIG